MFFRNAHIFSFPADYPLPLEVLEHALNAKVFQPCPSSQPSSAGFVSPVPNSERLTRPVVGYVMLCLQTEEKLLPATVVQEALADKIEQIEAERGTPVRKMERGQLRDEIILDLLPRAFSVHRKLYAYLDLANRWLVVDTPSAAKAEVMAFMLRSALGSFPAQHLVADKRPANLMTGWLQTGYCPPDFRIGGNCVLKSTDEEDSTLRASKQDLSANEIVEALENGKEAVELALTYGDRISFALDDNLRIKRLRFLDVIQEQAADLEAEDAAARFDADFSIMAPELAALVNALLSLFGGLKVK